MEYDEHTPFRENIPAYALGALDAEDVAALESHLQTCASCRTELAEYRAVSDSLLTAIPPQQPPRALRQRLQAQLPSARKAQRPRFAWSFGQVALGIALIVLLAMNAISLTQIQALQNQQAELLNQMHTDQTTLAMLSYPNTQTILIAGDHVTGTLLLNKEHSTAALITWNLPALAETQTYQIWLIEPNGHRVSAGLFRPKGDRAYTTKIIYSHESLSNFIGVGVTVEPAGGSDQPTGTRIFKVDF
jgi:anti-sigma-K factor RskA